MRLVFPVMLILLGVLLLGFLITNPAERVNITVGNMQYENQPLSLVVLIALSVGVVFTAVVALIEGATIRLANHRLRREIQRLETENSFLRSQARPPSAVDDGPSPTPAHREADPAPLDEPGPGPLASAPVYDPAAGDPATRGD